MTAPVIPPLPTDTGQLGPGVLKIGEVGTEIDVSCYVNDAAVEWSDSATDATTKLCGAVRAGVTTFTAQLTGNIDVDAGNDSGLFALSWNEKGSQQTFEFTPSTALGTTVSGILTIKPLRFGADEYGADLTSDIAWDIVGDPVLSFDGAAVAATGATAGSPGTFTPAGATVPANLAALQAAAPPVVAAPTTAWTVGQSVNLGTGSAHWDGAAYVAGVA